MEIFRIVSFTALTLNQIFEAITLSDYNQIVIRVSFDFPVICIDYNFLGSRLEVRHRITKLGKGQLGRSSGLSRLKEALDS